MACDCFTVQLNDLSREDAGTGMGHHQAKPKKNSHENSSQNPSSGNPVQGAAKEHKAGENAAEGQGTPDGTSSKDVAMNKRGSRFLKITKVTPTKVKNIETEELTDSSLRSALFQVQSDNSSVNSPDIIVSDSDGIVEIRMSHLGFGRYGNIITEPLPNNDTEEGFISITQLFNSMSDGQVRSYVSDPLFMLLLDARSGSHYEKEHIRSAYHHTALDQSGTLQPVTEYTLVVMYDEDGLSLSLTSSRLSRIHEKLRRQGVDVFILERGFKGFKSAHRYLVTDRVPLSDREPQRQVTTYPSIILDNKLYQGRCDQALEKKILDNLKITHIVNITVNRPCPFTDTIQYLNILLEDEFKSDLLAAFPNVIKFIRKALEEGGRVLVHCKLGVSRSSTVVLAYLMHEYHWNLRDAYHFLKERRPVIRPNRGFLKQLSQFEEMLFGCKSADTDDLFF